MKALTAVSQRPGTVAGRLASEPTHQWDWRERELEGYTHGQFQEVWGAGVRGQEGERERERERHGWME